MPLTKEEKEKLMNLKNEAEAKLSRRTVKYSLRVRHKEEEGTVHIRFYKKPARAGAEGGEHYVSAEEVLADRALIEDYCARTVKGFANRILRSGAQAGRGMSVSHMIQQLFTRLYRIFGDCTPQQYIPRKVMIENWIAAQPAPSYRIEELVFQTMRGEKVRSKFEKMVADTLFICNIPYHYEHLIKLNGEKLLPDFTLMDPNTGHFIYLEACGLLTDRNYVARNLEKLRTYERAGLFADEKLMYVFDDPAVPFDTELFRIRLNKRFGIQSD